MPDTLPLKPIDVDTVDKLTAAVSERAIIAKAIEPRSGPACATSTSSAPAARSSAATRPTTCSSEGAHPRLPAAERRAQQQRPASHGRPAPWSSWPRTPARPRRPSRRRSTAKAHRRDRDRRGQGGQPAGRGRRRGVLRQERRLRAASWPMRCSRRLGTDLDAALPATLDGTARGRPERGAGVGDDAGRHRRDDFKDEPITYVLGSGPCYGWAYGLAMCFLQEMQWKHAAAFNTGEFFQGAFEMVDDDTAVLLLARGRRDPSDGRARQAVPGTYARRRATSTCGPDPARASRPTLRGDVSGDRRGRTRQPAGPALRGGARPRPRAAPLHVQGRLLIGAACRDGPARRTNPAAHQTQERTWLVELRRGAIPPHPVRARSRSPTRSGAPSAEALAPAPRNLFFVGSGGAGILMLPAAAAAAAPVHLPGPCRDAGRAGRRRASVHLGPSRSW